MNKLKFTILIETIILIILIIAFVNKNSNEVNLTEKSDGLLAKRIYYGLLPEKNLLILNFESLKLRKKSVCFS